MVGYEPIHKQKGSSISSRNLSLIAAAAWFFVAQGAAIILIVISQIVLMFTVLEVYRRLSKEHQNYEENEDEKRKREYRQFESMLSIFFTIKPELPLPDTKGWAAGPDLLNWR